MFCRIIDYLLTMMLAKSSGATSAQSYPNKPIRFIVTQ